jgi:hypothetical protein
MDCLGQHVDVNNKDDDTVTAVQLPPPGASHLVINLDVNGGTGNLKVVNNG